MSEKIKKLQHNFFKVHSGLKIHRYSILDMFNRLDIPIISTIDLYT